LARLNSANAEVAADQREVDRLNALEVRRASKLIGIRPSAKKLVVFIPAANYCCRVATQVAKKFEGIGRGPLTGDEHAGA
jgi:hypothetical protein